MNRTTCSTARLALGLALVLGGAGSATAGRAKEPKPHGATPPAAPAAANQQDIGKLAKAFEVVKTGMTRAEIEKAVGAPGRLRTKACDLKVGEVTGITIENGKVTGTWSSGSELENKLIGKIATGMRESEARRLLSGRAVSQCEIYRWGPDAHPFDVSFASGKAFRISFSQGSE